MGGRQSTRWNMSSDQTLLSKKLSPVIEEYGIADVLLITAAVITLVSLFTPLIHPLIGVGVGWATYLTISASDFYEENDHSPLKNGLYTEIEESDSTFYCSDCGDTYHKKRGYKMAFIAGYELFRTEQFHSEECEVCELDDDMEEERLDEEKVTELA